MENQDAANQTEQGKTIVRAILARSATQFEFRQQLLADPRSAVAEYMGVGVSELPEGFSLAFSEEPQDGAVTLPDYLGPDAELVESELEMVSGGSTTVCAGFALAALVITAVDWYMEDR